MSKLRANTNFRSRTMLLVLTLVSTATLSVSAFAVTGPEILDVQVGRSHYLLREPELNSPAHQPFDAMNDADKTAFNTNRRMFMSALARGLQLIKYGVGVAVVTKDSVKFKLKGYRIRNSTPAGRAMSPGLEADFVAAQERAISEMENEHGENVSLGFRERAHRSIQRILEGTDETLWKQAPILAHSNEYGLVATLGAEVLAGKPEKGWGGLIDLGVSIGYNRDEQSLVIQIFRDLESYKTTVMPAVFIAGLVSKAGVYVANQQPGMLHHDGISYYPPLAPAFSSITNDSFMVGLSSGLTWPPSPLGDLLTYTDKLDQTMILRVSFSKLKPGFLQVQTGLGAKSLGFVLKPVKKIIAYFKSIIAKNSCNDDLKK